MNKVELFIEDEEDIYGEEYIKEDLSNLDIKNKTLSTITLDRCSLINSDYENTYFEKVIFNNCDLSNTKFINCNFREVKFNNCKLVGTNINNCHITKNEICNSLCKYINIVDTKTKELIIKENDFTESSFFNVEFIKVTLDKNNFKLSEFLETKLSGINFSTCNIEGIKLDSKGIKGIQVNQFQAIDLASLLGIEIVE